MSAGLFALLDDVAALAKLAAASVDDVGAAAGRASAKAAGVVVDDTAVTPQYLAGSAAERELPIIRKITIGSLRNKLLFILPVALVLSEFWPQGLPLLLIVGGTYLAFEGAEKVWERVSGHHLEEEKAELEGKGEFTPEHEKRTVAGAIRTDFILSAEIMVIALNQVVDSQPEAGFLMRAAILAVVAVLITVLVYGVVALIVKMDDIGLRLAMRDSERSKKVGRGLVSAMPRLLAAISVIGTLAMLWVGGHILLTSLDELGVHAPYGLVHDLEVAVHDAIGSWVGSALGWLVNTLASAVVGLAVGAVVVVVMHLLPFGKHEKTEGAESSQH
jgi:predicted DNA repair protein MutK